MSTIIGNVGRRAWKVRILNAFIHLVLICGAVTMVYPFLIMISGSLKSSVDYKNFEVIPSYLHNDEVLFQKYLVTKYNDMTNIMKRMLKETGASAENIRPPERFSEGSFNDFRDFATEEIQKLGPFFYSQGMVAEYGVYPMELRHFRSWLQKKYGKGMEGLAKLNREVGSEYGSWEEVRCPAEDFAVRRGTGNYQGFLGRFNEFKISNNNILTRFYIDTDGLFVEILQRDYARSLHELNAALDTSYRGWKEIVAPEKLPANPKLARAWETFVRNEVNLQFLKVDPSAVEDYRKFLSDRYQKDIKVLNRSQGSNYRSFAEIPLVDKVPSYGGVLIDWNDFISEKAPLDKIRVRGLSSHYRDFLKARYGGDLDKLNSSHLRGYKDFSEVELTQSPPEDNVVMRADWSDYVNTLDPSEVRLKRAASMEYRKHLGVIYAKGLDGGVDFTRMSSDYAMRIAGKDQIPSFNEFPDKSTTKARADYGAAVKTQKFKEMRVIREPAKLREGWAAFLESRYKGGIAELNRKYGFCYESFDTVPVHMLEWEWGLLKRNKASITAEFLWRNYAMVLDTVLFNGYAAVNTLVYCLLAILAALIVNPLAAYALSRYNPPSTYKILLLLMLTMAFPPMVLGIPNFLMIKNMGLLNTFAALILPSMASGYSIFLLKGFFDSLPKELFECATLDGASEWTMFWQIAMTLSKPILAVIALQTFVAAYSNFMMAFLVCQNPKMWTIMVYLYQLQQRSSQSVGFAALVIAAIPTFLVFIFCQNIIIRGIVVPTEK